MPETSGRPAAPLANPIGFLMFSENIWQRLSALIHLTWQNFAIWASPCSVRIFSKHTLTNVNAPKVESTEKWRLRNNTVFGNPICGARVFFCRVFVLSPQPQVTLMAGSFALFNVSLTVHTRGYWYQRPVNICRYNAGQNGCRLG